MCKMYTLLIVLLVISFAAAVPNCPATNGDQPTYFPHETSCSNFYECSHGIAYTMECPAGLDFNTRLNVCDLPERAGCRSTAKVPQTAD
ncbi:peritrophin-1-like [Anoplophora glabripennis]|uniref:peritrophin-1-like n=1 Tax=Anoplophora glabripennis TaxID=217634 RepID=UPI0008742CFF|nr:peritrophin-1-like [Anoplophora glabripennis]